MTESSRPTTSHELPNGFVAEVKDYLTVFELRQVQEIHGKLNVSGGAIDAKAANAQSDALAKMAIVSLRRGGEPVTDGAGILEMIQQMPLETYVGLSEVIEKLLEPAVKKAQRTSAAMPPAPGL